MTKVLTARRHTPEGKVHAYVDEDYSVCGVQLYSVFSFPDGGPTNDDITCQRCVRGLKTLCIKLLDVLLKISDVLRRASESP